MPVIPRSDELSRFSGQPIQIYGQLATAGAPSQPGRQRRVLQLDQGPGLALDAPAGRFSDCTGPLRLEGRLLPDDGSQRFAASDGECLQPNSPGSWLRDLGLDAVSQAHKQEAIDRLANLAEAGVPLLIAHLQDRRLYGSRLEIPGAAVNAPAQIQPPQPRRVPIPVAEVCEDLLYSLLMPEYRSPYAGQFKPYNSALFKIRNWPAWWQKHGFRGLAALRQELEPRVDAYWRSHGVTQILDD